jgi:hypothetical protein
MNDITIPIFVYYLTRYQYLNSAHLYPNFILEKPIARHRKGYWPKGKKGAEACGVVVLVSRKKEKKRQ